MAMIWSLLISEDQTASLIPLHIKWNEGTSSSYINTRVSPDSHDAIESAQESSKLIYNILRKEGYLRKSVLARYQLEISSTNIIGKSAGLAFAIAFLIKAFPRRTFRPIAATGVIQENGMICRVEGFVEKINIALDTLPKSSLICFPEGNANELNSKTINRAIKREIELLAINRIEEVIERLGIKLDKIYSYSPYRGLESFKFEHAGIFFGRHREIETLCKQLNSRAKSGKPSVIVVGGSGSGKSSLVLAGVLPELIQRDGWPSNVQGRYGQFSPREAGLESLNIESMNFSDQLNALYKSVFTSWIKGLGVSEKTTIPDSLDKLRSETLINWLHQVNQTLPRQTNIDKNRFVWVVDQLEELFTLGFQTEAIEQFCAFLSTLAKDEVYLIVTLRNDFYDQYQKQAVLMDHFRDNGQYNLGIIGREAIDQIIREPAQMADCTFETDPEMGNLADRIQRDAGGQSAVLPLLEFTLSELYELSDKTQRILSHADYEIFDGLEGCIGHRAEAVYQELDQESQNALPSLIRRLSFVAANEAKPVAARAIDLEFYSAQSSKLKAIDRMTEARLFIKERIDDRTQIRVAHEALLTKWVRARSQIDQDRSDLKLMWSLEDQARRWQDAKEIHRSSFLLRDGIPLIEAVNLQNCVGDDFSPLVNKYINESHRFEEQRLLKEEQHKKQLNYRLRIGVFLTTLALSVAGWTYWTKKIEDNANLTTFHQGLQKQQDLYLHELKLKEDNHGVNDMRLLSTLEQLRLNYLKLDLINDAKKIERRVDLIKSIERKEQIKKQKKWLIQEKRYLKELRMYSQKDKRLIYPLQKLKGIYIQQGRHKDAIKMEIRIDNLMRQFN